MKLSSFQKIAPADVAVGSIPFRGGLLDIYPVTSDDVFWMMARAPEVANILSGSGDQTEKGFAFISALGKSGPEVLERLLVAAVQETPEVLAEHNLNLEEKVEIVAAMLDLGVPDNFVGKLRGAATGAIARAQGRQAATLETPLSISSTDSSRPVTTLTK